MIAVSIVGMALYLVLTAIFWLLRGGLEFAHVLGLIFVTATIIGVITLLLGLPMRAASVRFAGLSCPHESAVRSAIAIGDQAGGLAGGAVLGFALSGASLSGVFITLDELSLYYATAFGQAPVVGGVFFAALLAYRRHERAIEIAESVLRPWPQVR